jgi:hypothetical protein
MVAFLSACNARGAYVTTPQMVSWEFIQSAGGIRIEPPHRQNGSSWMLPVICDLSGLKTITTRPSAMHSGVVVTKVLFEIVDHEINIVAVAAVPLGTGQTSACPPIAIKDVDGGEYRVQYRDGPEKHGIGLATFK